MNEIIALITGFLMSIMGLFGSPTLGATPVIMAPAGGTGFGSTTAGNVGKVLAVADDSPFRWELSAAGSGTVTGSGTNGNCAQWTSASAIGDAGSPCGTGAGGGDPFTHPAAGQSATTSLMLFNGQASSTQFSAYRAYFGGTATSTFDLEGDLALPAAGTLTVPALTSALLLTDSGGLLAEYTGTTCTNQFVRILSALGVATCATVGTADVAGLDISADTNLAVTSPIILTDDTISFSFATANTWTALNQFNGQASSTLFSCYGPCYFGATATSSFSTAGALTLITPLTVANGGTGATSLTDGGVLLGSGTGAITPMSVLADGSIIVGDGTTDPVALAAFESSTGDLAVTAGGTGVGTLTGLIQGNGTSDFTVVTDSSTVGQILRVTGASTYAWGAINLDDTDAFTGTLPASAIEDSYLLNTGDTGTGDYTLDTPTFVLDSTGDEVAIGTTTQAWPLTVHAASESQIALSSGVGIAQWTMRNAGGNLYFSTTTVAGTATSTPAAIEFRNSGTALGIATSSPWRTLSVTGSVAFDGLTQATGDNALCIDATTKEIEDGNGATCALSTILAKENVLSLNTPEAIAILEKLRPVTFDWKPSYQPAGDAKESISLIAEEVAATDKRFADNDNDGKPHGLVVNAFLGLFTSVLQSHESRLDKIEARLDYLERENKALKSAIQCRL